jgi:hypothetical protein
MSDDEIASLIAYLASPKISLRDGGRLSIDEGFTA